MKIKKICKLLIAYPERELYRAVVPTDENVICFESSPDYSDNSWVLFNYMIDHGYNKKYKLYWIADRHNETIEKFNNVQVVLRKNYTEAVKLLYKSKFVFYTHGMTGLIRIKEDQTIVNLWHGCGYKASRTRDLHGKLNIKRLFMSSRLVFDYVLVPGTAFIKTKSEFFHCDESKVIPIGYPRYDLLHSSTINWDKVKEIWTINDEKIVMWLPTYRKTGDSTYGENNMENQYWLPLLRSDDDLKTINQYCEENNIILIIKKHRLQSIFFKEGEFGHIRFLDDDDLNAVGIQLYEVFQYTDALISDYSSVAIDYLLLDKPLAFTLDDYDEYAAKRGFVFDNAKDYMPGYHIYKIQEMKLFFKDINAENDVYRDKRNKLIPILQSKSDCYSQAVLDFFGV